MSISNIGEYILRENKQYITVDNRCRLLYTVYTLSDICGVAQRHISNLFSLGNED